MANTYLTKTFASGGSTTKWTYSVWLKRSKLSYDTANIFGRYQSSSYFTGLYFSATDGIQFLQKNVSNAGRLMTSDVYRDTSAWYHIVAVWDSSNATADDRMKIYVNGVSPTIINRINPSSGHGSTWNTANPDNDIGRANGMDGNTNYFDGLMSHIHFCDGYAYSASDFGETDATDGMWKIKTSPSVSYGTTGFNILKDGNSVTDTSPNSNNFTVGGGTLTATEDNPSNNFTAMNPLLKSSYCTLSNGNTKTTGNSGADTGNCSTTLLATTGLYYAEIKSGTIYGTTYPRVGVQHTPNTNYGRGINGTDGGAGGQGTPNNNEGYACANGQKFTSNTLSSFASAWVATDILAVAMDCTNGAAYVAINNVWQNSGDPTSGASKTGALVTWTPSDVDATAFASCDYNGSFLEWNFGNGYFGSTVIGSAVSSGNGLWKYSPPTNYVSLNTKEINS